MHAVLSFLCRSSPLPAFVVNDGDRPATRLGTYEDVSVELIDARNMHSPPTIWREGFCMIERRLPGNPEGSAEDMICFLGAVENEVRAVLGSTQTKVIDHTVRSSSPGGSGRGIVTHVHNDYTPASAMGHAVRLFGETAKAMRVVQVNAWVPLVDRVIDAPLAIADGQSVLPEDLVRCEIRYPDRVGEIQEVRHNSDQKWYWYPEMRSDELLLFKGYDSNSQVSSVPHTAFKNEQAPAGVPPRKSVEVRLIALLSA